MKACKNPRVHLVWVDKQFHLHSNDLGFIYTGVVRTVIMREMQSDII